MKSDYESLGSQALKRLRLTCEDADRMQIETLFHLLQTNKDTEFGKSHTFSAMESIADFQDRIPLSDYEDYAGQIARIISGESNILTAKDAIYFCISSGTTGKEKYLPLTEEDIRLQCIYAYGMIYGMVREYYPGKRAEDIFGKIFQVGEFAKTYMPDGRMNGIRSGCIYQWMDRNGEFDASDYCVPKEVLFPDALEDLLYVKVRFALEERDLMAIHGVFVNRVAGVMDYIYHHWELLLHDMETGTVDDSVELDDKWRRFVIERLPADPVRARELREIPKDRLRDGMVGRIWSNMKYILAIGGSSFAYYTEKMRQYAGDIPIYHYAYAASEGIFGVAERMNAADRYILLPETGFFEFLPLQGPEKPLIMSEIETGEKYELVFTNRSGLYRCRLGDVVRVVGWYHKAPVVEYCYRLNQAINIAGEKTNCEQLRAAVQRFSEITNTSVSGYCVREEVSRISPCYLFYIECAGGGVVEHADGILEQCMREANFEYRACAMMHEIAPLHAVFLKAGSFTEYERRLAASGKFVGQSKLLHFLETEGQKQFFAAQIIKRESGL